LRTNSGVLLGAAATSAAACFVDFRLTPHRFTPGYEHRLSDSALAAVYAAFAVGLAAGAMALRDRYPADETAQARALAHDPAKDQDDAHAHAQAGYVEPRITRRVRAGNV
jgi:hypothetical protein